MEKVIQALKAKNPQPNFKTITQNTWIFNKLMPQCRIQVKKWETCLKYRGI